MKIGILGLGSMGARHHENAKKLGHQVEGYDPFGHNAFVRDEVIKWSDAVVIASPTERHFVDLGDCLKAGKHVLIEKPLCVDSEFGLALVEKRLKEATLDGVAVMVGYNLRYHSGVKQIKEWLARGKIGRPLWANLICAQHNQKPDYLRDGVTLNWSHEIDLALYLLGPAVVECASVDKEDSIADINLVHESGCRSAIHLDYHARPEIRDTVIVGTEGHIRTNLVIRNSVLSPATDIQTLIPHKDTFEQNYSEEMSEFIEAVHGREPTMGATGTDGLATMWICHDAKKKAGIS